MTKEKQKENSYTRVQSLGESSNYILIVGTLPEGHGEYEGLHYLLINKDTDVIEVETRILPKAHEYLDQLQGAIDAKFERDRGEGGPDPLTPSVIYDH